MITSKDSIDEEEAMTKEEILEVLKKIREIMQKPKEDYLAEWNEWRLAHGSEYELDKGAYYPYLCGHISSQIECIIDRLEGELKQDKPMYKLMFSRDGRKSEELTHGDDLKYLQEIIDAQDEPECYKIVEVK